LHETAFKVLKDQLSLTSSDHERIFLNPKNNQPWRDDRAIYHNCWVPSLKLSGVKFRKQYNTRHTYASTMLTKNKPIAWVAKQLGHSDIAMMLRNYDCEITDPKYICISECKKVWWDNDMHIEASILKIPNCPMCGGLLKIASKNDYERLN
jgi:integrase